MALGKTLNLLESQVLILYNRENIEDILALLKDSSEQ